jgi:hypothetical protein
MRRSTSSTRASRVAIEPLGSAISPAADAGGASLGLVSQQLLHQSLFLVYGLLSRDRLADDNNDSSGLPRSQIQRQRWRVDGALAPDLPWVPRMSTKPVVIDGNIVTRERPLPRQISFCLIRRPSASLRLELFEEYECCTLKLGSEDDDLRE